MIAHVPGLGRAAVLQLAVGGSARYTLAILRSSTTSSPRPLPTKPHVENTILACGFSRFWPSVRSCVCPRSPGRGGP
jgi:hypothetical protein